MTPPEIDTLKNILRKKNMSELIETSSLEAYAKNNTVERENNLALKEFADIRGVGLFTLSAKTKQYVKNELWKDIAIEGGAIALGALTAGAGYAGVRMVMAANWARKANQARSAYQMSTLGTLGATTLGQGVGFEL